MMAVGLEEGVAKTGGGREEEAAEAEGEGGVKAEEEGAEAVAVIAVVDVVEVVVVVEMATVVEGSVEASACIGGRGATGLTATALEDDCSRFCRFWLKRDMG